MAPTVVAREWSTWAGMTPNLRHTETRGTAKVAQTTSEIPSRCLDNRY